MTTPTARAADRPAAEGSGKITRDAERRRGAAQHQDAAVLWTGRCAQ
jgi:hypothetical protein